MMTYLLGAQSFPFGEKVMDITELQPKTLEQLRVVARDWDIPAYSRLKKDDLILRLMRANAEKPESELPSFSLSILPVILPIVLISLASTFIAIQGKGFDTGDAWAEARTVASAAPFEVDGRSMVVLRCG